MIKNTEFLRLVARAFVKNEGSAYIKMDAASAGNMQPFGDTVFVFPNRRSMKFFQKYLGEEYGSVTGKPLFSPQMITISELFGELSGLQMADPIEALYILYQNYIKLKFCKTGSVSLEQAMEQESFDEFVHWGGTIVADFNDVDKYLIDSRQLFTNIRDLKEIESDYSFLSDTQRKAVEQFWSNFLKGGSNFKTENFSALWSIMYELYTAFGAELRGRGLGYEGMIYRSVAEKVMHNGNLEAEGSGKLKDMLCPNGRGKIVFIGFNAPNKCEKALMDYLKNSGKGDFYWDFYGPMVTDAENKASMFISDAVREYPGRYELNQTAQEIPQFNVIGVPSGVGQAFVVSNILKEIKENAIKGADDNEKQNIVDDLAFKTAVVLPDETLLMPVLNSVPQEFETVNVTMGFPISATPLVSFMNGVSLMQKDIKERDGKSCFYHAHVVKLLEHEYVRNTVQEEGDSLVNEIIKQNKVFIEPYTNLNHPLLKAIFKIPANSNELLGYLIDILKELDLSVGTLNKEFIYRYYLALDRLKKLDIPMVKETCLRLVLQITSSITIPFKGEPLSGLQIIGSLETRALDFENVIILNVNEGRFPASAQQNSLIPYNLRIGFGLPTYEVTDAIAAYHFYRSIYRAKNVWLLYDTRSEGVQSGEASRYVKQLKYHYNINLKESVVGLSEVQVSDNGILQVIKTPQIMQRLKDKFAGVNGKCFSASSLKTYISCPMRFYLEKIEGIKEQESVSEELDGGEFGTLFHYVMEHIYKNDPYEQEHGKTYLGQLVSRQLIEREIKDTDKIYSLIDRGFKEELKIKEIVGQNLIIREVVKKYVLLTLAEDIKYTPFMYIASEKDYYHHMKISDALVVNFIAKIDRIDKVGNSLRVVDYKTTSKSAKDRKVRYEIADLLDKGYKERYRHWIDETFQLYLYACVLANNPTQVKLPDGSPVNFAVREDDSACGKDSLDMVIYPITGIAKDDSVICETIYKHKLNEFESALKECIEEIFNENIPFEAAKNDKNCEYCMFKNICGR